MPQTPTPAFFSLEPLAALTPPAPALGAGSGDTLRIARQQSLACAQALRTLLDQAPKLRDTLHRTLQQQFGVDPQACGLEHDLEQIDLLNFSARILASPVFAVPFANWSTWGFAKTARQATWSANDWLTGLAAVRKQVGPNGWLNYWAGRMPGKTISRQAHATELLRQHFAASLDLAVGLGQIAPGAWFQGQPHTDSEQALIHWRHATGSQEVCISALLIKPRPTETRWLLYRPAARKAVQAFANEADLRVWLHEHRDKLWPSPDKPLDADQDSTAILFTDAQAKGFSQLLEQTLSEKQRGTARHLALAAQKSQTAPLDWTQLLAWETQKAIAPRPKLQPADHEQVDALIAHDQQLAAEELHFDALPGRLPLGWRNQRIARQEQLLATYLGNDTALTSQPMTRLRAHQATLDSLDSAFDSFLGNLPETLTAQTWGEQQNGVSRFDFLSRHLADTLKGEAALQHLLGELSKEHLGWVEHIVARPEPSLQRTVQPYALKLELGTRRWQLTGFLALQAIPEDNTKAADQSLLLFKTGRDGGLMRLDDPSQLSERLLATLYGAWPESLFQSAWPHDPQALMQALHDSKATPRLIYTPITSHVFDYCTQTVLATLPSMPAPSAPAALQTLETRLAGGSNLARIHAFAKHAERNRTALIEANLTSVQHLDLPERTALAAQVEAMRNAMLDSSLLLQRDLPERSQFARDALQARLRTDFAVDVAPSVSLDIADRIIRTRVPLPESGIGHAYKEVISFSQARSTVELSTFLLWALDDQLTLRLSNANILIAGNAVPSRLREGLHQTYIANLVRTLDVAGAYEKRITDAFKGLPEDTVFETQRRQEALRAPVEHQLKIITLSRSRHLDTQGQQMLERFCREQQDASLTRTVAYHALTLRPGVAVDGSSQAVTLAGIFLLQAATGPTLLLLPEAPNDKVISQYATPQQACRALEQMALDQALRTYLAQRVLDGDERAHLAYIDTALAKGFSGFIMPGLAIPGLLAEHQASLLMGRQILANRATSRSQRDLYLETEAVRHGRVYDYIKMALGFVPVVGTAIALYDGWHAANESVEAFLRGDPGEGLRHLNSVLLSLIDAIMDLAPVIHTPGAPRLKTRQPRQIAHTPPSTTASLKHSAFNGYEVTVPTGRWIDNPHPHGAGVHRHVQTGADYVIRQGRYYAVEWDGTDLTWRLKGTATRTYRQPIRLSETATWETHGSLGGHLVDSGLAGGGAYVSALYNRSLATLRGALGMRARQLTPMDTLRDIYNNRQTQRAALSAKVDALNKAQGMGPNGPVGPRASAATIGQARQAVITQLRHYIDFHEQSLDRLRAIRSEIGRANARNIIEELVYDLRRQHPKLIELLHIRMQAKFEQIEPLHAAVDGVISTAELRLHLQSLHRVRGELTSALTELEQELRRCARLRNQLRGDNLTRYEQDLEGLGIPLRPNGYQVVRVSELGPTILNPKVSLTPEFGLFGRQLNSELDALRGALFSHADLPLAQLSRRDEHRFLTQLLGRYRRFDNHMRLWEDHYPDFVQPQAIGQMRNELTVLIAEVEQSIAATAPRQAPPAPRRGAGRPRLFESEDLQLFVGHERTVDGQPHMQINHGAISQPHATFSRTQQGRWRQQPTDPGEIAASLQGLQAAAQSRMSQVAAVQANLRRYKTQNMLPQDLEDYAHGYANSLREIATAITRQAGASISDTLKGTTNRLEQAATQLETVGRQLRIEQTKASPKPTSAHLEYLNAQGEVTPRWSRTLEPAKNRQGQPLEYLEEYKVIDNSTDEPLWYAHFHFKKKPRQHFGGVEAGHLKLASERNLKAGAWRGALTEAQANALFGGLRPNDA